MKTADELRAEARQHDENARESFERCDTDGALSQWCSGLSAQKARLEADLIDKGGVAEFLTLFDLEGNYQPAVRIDARYGPRWMLLDADGKRTGEYLPFFPARRDTLAKRGYVEGYAIFPAKADYKDGPGGLVGVRVVTVKRVPHHAEPVEVVTTDRWKEEA